MIKVPFLSLPTDNKKWGQFHFFSVIEVNGNREKGRSVYTTYMALSLRNALAYCNVSTLIFFLCVPGI